MALSGGLCAHGLVGRIYRVGYGLDYSRYCQCLDALPNLIRPLSLVAGRLLLRLKSILINNEITHRCVIFAFIKISIDAI